MTEMLILLLFPALMAYAACSDLVSMTISNRVCLTIVAAFFIVAPAIGLPLGAMAWHVAAGVIVLFITFAMFSAGWIGGGDAKLGRGHRALARLGQAVRLRSLWRHLWWRAHPGAADVPHHAAAALHARCEMAP